MPSFILKAEQDPTSDLYCEWSTIVDNVTRWGSREDFLERTARDRLDRADATGTSCIGFESEGDGYRFGAWSDGSLIVTNTKRQDYGFFWLQRTDLAEYLRLGVETAAAEALLVPIEDEDEEVSA